MRKLRSISVSLILLVLLTGLLPAIRVLAAPEVKESYELSDASFLFYGVTQEAQTFTTTSEYRITGVQIKVYREGADPGTVYVRLRSVDGSGNPTGSVLSTGTVAGATLQETQTWETITFDSPYNLTSGTKYAIAVQAPNAVSGNRLAWRGRYNTGTYTGGTRVSHNGLSWSIKPNDDYTFRIMGEVVDPTLTTSAATAVTASTARLNGEVTSTGGENPTVTFYWGETDEGEVPASWSNNSTPTSPAQPQSAATAYKTITGLTPNTTYYFKAKATNSVGTSWGATQNFTSLMPSVTTQAATSVSYATAKVNSLVVSDGDETLEVRFQYNTTDNFTNGGTANTTWVADYTAGNTPFANLSGLVDSTLYYFRVQYRVDGTHIYSGSSLQFTTTVIPIAPTSVKVYTEGTRNLLSWTKGENSSGTMVRYKLGSYPTTTADGSLLVNTTGGTASHTGIPSGTTYYYSLWGYSGTDYSVSYATVLGTTAAGADTEERAAPDTPALWFAATDYTRFSSMPLYDQFNDFADSLGIPPATAWFIGAWFISIALAVGVLGKSKNAAAALAVLGVAVLICSVLRLLPLWQLVFSALFFFGAAKMTSHQQGGLR